MYEYIKGTVETIGPEYVVIENGGIGYEILTPNPFAFSPDQGGPAKVYTYQHVREDVMALYGFRTMEQKRMFKKLIGVSGIGPKGAMAILASGEPTGVIRAIENEDEKYLTKFPGVGKKTARQMILDLKGKLDEVLPESYLHLGDDELFKKPSAGGHPPQLEEALLALAALGYSERELKKITPGLEKEDLSTSDQYIKKALQLLMK